PRTPRPWTWPLKAHVGSPRARLTRKRLPGHRGYQADCQPPAENSEALVLIPLGAVTRLADEAHAVSDPRRRWGCCRSPEGCGGSDGDGFDAGDERRRRL